MPPEPAAVLDPEDRTYRKRIRSWALYDWANSAFATTVMAAVLPPFFGAQARTAGLSPDQATAYWAYTNAWYMVLIAVAGPLLGTLSDLSGGKKRFLLGFVLLGATATALLGFLGKDDYVWAAVLFMVGAIGFAGGNIFYESLLPHLARAQDLDRVSSLGYAFGYVGGGLLLALNALWITKPQWFGLPDATFAVRISFVAVAVWWLVFTLPLLWWVPEPPAPPGRARLGLGRALRSSWAQLAETFRHLRRYKPLLIFLVGFWIYNDGISTIIKMATKYGEGLGFGMSDLILALVLTQFIGFPCAIGFGALAGKIGAKRGILLGLGVYTLIAMLGYFMTNVVHFYILAALVGLVQGGTQALSRSLFASMVPRHQSAEFFGFYSTGAKFAGILGPFLFGFLAQQVGSRWGIVSVILFFVVGAILLCKVDERAGAQAAREAEAEAQADAELRSGSPGTDPRP